MYAGNVGTGFNYRSGRALIREMDPLRTEMPAIKLRVKGVIWIRPELVAEVQSTGLTDDGKLRHPSYKGLRGKADAADVFEL